MATPEDGNPQLPELLAAKVGSAEASASSGEDATFIQHPESRLRKLNGLKQRQAARMQVRGTAVTAVLPHIWPG